MSQTEAPQDKQRMYSVTRDRFHEAQYKQQNYFVQVPSGVKPEAMEDPAFFSLVAGMCRPSGRIFAESDDGLWCADVYIRAVGPNYAIARVLQVWDLSEYKGQPTRPPMDVAASGFTVGWGGRHHLWRVVRDSDSSVVHQNAATKEEAAAWLVEHLKAVAR